jgi:hypothetical protein
MNHGSCLERGKVVRTSATSYRFSGDYSLEVASEVETLGREATQDR